MACGFPIHSSPVMVNRLSCRKQDANACPGLRISGCFPVGPGLSEVWPQKVTDRSYLFDERQGGPSSVTDRVQTDEDTSFKHTRHQHPQMWKNASSFEMAEVNTNIFKSPPVGKRPSVTEWNLRTGSVKMLNQDLNQSKNLTQVLVPQKHMFPNAASPQFYSHTPPVQLYKTSNSLAKIWEAYQDSPCGAHWESFSREMQSPMGLNPVRETKEWRNKGQPLEDIFNVSQHKLRNIGINILGKQAKAVSCGTIWECQDDLPEGGDVGGKVGARYNHSKLPPKTQDILFEGTKLDSEQTPKEHHVVQHPRNIHHCSSLKENGLQKVCPGQYEGLLHPLELDNLSVSPSHFTCKEAADRWDRDLIKQSNLLSNSEVYKENDGHDYTQSQESQACEKAAQGWPGVNDRWACPVLETGYLSVKGTSELFEEALDHKSYLNWNGDNEHLPVSLDYPQPKAWPIPLSLYYPPSDTLEWSESPLPSWWDVPQRRTWGSTSPEVWDFPRMKLY
ncbi:uncharacterized protein [Heptranchias perlo]|uniref:uncharacterized protein n=1 Tax=Heptranchias perlo TaxID=212740 RepID=UPI00355A9F7A